MSKLQVRPGIMDIVPYVPGNVDTIDPSKVIYLASNESPLGASPAAITAFQAMSDKLYQYPDASSQQLREAIAAHYQLNAAQIICGNGSERLIDLVARAYAGPGDEILYSQYGFIMYPICALAAGAKPVTAAERNYTTDVDALLAAVTDKTRIVFVANPNNPTGTYISQAEVRRLREALPEHILLVIDSAYAEYVTAADYSAGHELVEENAANVVVLHTFSKIYGLAALRLGWAYCPSSVADVLDRIGGSFNVTMPAQQAGVAALADTAHIEQALAHNQQWLPWLSQALTELGLIAVPSAGNFVLLRFHSVEQCQAAQAYLSAQHIIVRPVAGYQLPDALRITVGTGEQNQACVAALKDFLAQQ